MLKLNVKITFPDGQSIFCGELFTTFPDFRGKIEGTFQYTREYLEHVQAFPLDPEHLPLGPQEYYVQRPEGVHGVFEDALPDNWGRALLVKKAKLARADQTALRLLEALGSNGLGALSFDTGKEKTYMDSSATLHELETLVDAALNYDAGFPVDNKRLQALFACGSSPGGARPKVLVKDKSGGLWIAKFPKFNDTYHVEPIEAATLQIAHDAGLPVPDFVLQTVGDRKILLVKRFDVTKQGGRHHMISMQTLLNAEGYYHMSYSDIFTVLKKHSAQPSKDISFLFRQMVFNIAIGNTDDHLKNFCMLHKDSGFCLSPAYDLLPDIHQNREHRISFPQGAGTLPPNRKILERIGDIYNVPQVDQIINDIFQAVVNWQDVFWQYKVPEDDLQKLEVSINHRLNLLEKPQHDQSPKLGG
ncbi:MAG: type II toxin-antitoxin system HipA family toxin [Desulfobacteraceae bacterium]|nr:type II toxin-antitoxin system HipA family toxin [Desulfobacteraceae bacterium]